MCLASCLVCTAVMLGSMRDHVITMMMSLIKFKFKNFPPIVQNLSRSVDLKQVGMALCSLLKYKKVVTILLWNVFKQLY